ncbi:MAG TPA: sigma-70 family RNA polymerase sigma factor [Clostridiales bacterium]|mgnify:CR=1 FL=1|nr:sigma-70 family RNA polymerase sigma factor [Clostridiales bacterium]
MINEDRHIIEKILKGEQNEFSLIMEKYGQMVYRVCFGFMKNEQEAMDMAQEVFISVYNNLDKFNFKSTLSTWIYRICTNTCLTQLNKLGKIQVCTEYIEPRDYSCLLPDEVSELKELKELINIQMEKLPDKSKNIVKLRLFNQLSFNEIGEKLNIPSSSARTNFIRSRKRLQKAVNNYSKECE